MESTLLTSVLKSSKIKRWLADPDSPPIVQEIKQLYDRIYTPNNTDTEEALADDDIDINNGLSGSAIPKVLRPFVPSINTTIYMRARCKLGGIVYSTSLTHQGNSQVYFYPGGDKISPPVPGFIKYIFLSSDRLVRISIAVQRATDVEKTIVDPFAKYPHWPSKLYKSHLSTSYECIHPDWIYGHFARWDFTSEEMVILSLNRVRCLQLHM